MPPITQYRTRPLGFLARYVRRRPLGHATILTSVLLAVACALGSQYAIKNLIDVVSANRTAAIWAAFLVLIALIVADNLFWRIAGWVASRTFVRVSGDVRRDLFDHVSRHAPSYYADRQPGMIAGRITSTANATYTTENTFVMSVLPPCFAVTGAIVILATVNPMMAGGLVLVAAIMVFAIYRLARRGTPLHHGYAANAAAVDGELVDVIGNMGTVRLFGATLLEQKRLQGHIDTEMASRERSLKYLELLRIFHAVVTAGLTAALLGWVLHLWGQGRATPGDIVLVSSLGFAILHGTRDLAVALVDLTQHVARIAEAISSLLLLHEMPDAPDAKAVHISAHEEVSIAFEGVQFGYPGRAPVLKDFSLHIAPGERVGLVGPSGAGKSTVLLLLQRFYDPQSGRIAIQQEDIRNLEQDSLHRAIAVVPQDIALFHRSVRENIRYGAPDADDEAVRAAAKAARCLDFIQAMPQGFDTVVGHRGVKLSGGQRQRLAIARAFLKDAPVLVLDEATSALDSESEAAIQAALDRLMRGRSVIAIAHRLSTLRSFDRIVVMQDGRIADQGSPQALSQRPGLYRDLLQQQMHPHTEEAGTGT